MQYVIKRTCNVNKIRHIVVDHLEVRLADHMCNIRRRTCYEIIHTDNVIPFTDELIAQMTSQKSGSAGN